MPPASRVPLFLLVFALLFLFALVIVIAEEFSDVKWVEAVVRIAEGLGRLTFVSIAITFILVEGIPMLAAWYKRQMVKEAREQGREEGLEEGLVKGREEEREAWFAWTDKMNEWVQRRVAAEREGRPFHEPLPPAPDGEQDATV